MSSNIYRKLVVLGVTFLVIPACGGNRVAPLDAFNTRDASIQGSNADSSGAAPTDTTSILKLLTKDVTIGSTVDPSNGDKGPRAVSVVINSYGELKAHQVLVCNFEDSAGNAGNGTTIEQFEPAAGSSPTTFFQNAKIEGCDGDIVDGGDQVYATGLTSKVMVRINQTGQLKKTYSSPITQPLGDGLAPMLYGYSPEIVFVGNADSGVVDRYNFNGYGGAPVEVINGFDVNKGAGWSALGPSGIAYWCGQHGKDKCPYKTKGPDTLYIADGACNAVVAISHASNLLER